MLVYGGITTRGGDGLNRTFGRPTRPAGGTAVLSAGQFGQPEVRPYFRPADRPAEGTAGLSAGRAGRLKVRPYLRPFFRPKQGGGDGLNRTFGRPIGRPKVRRADRYAEPQVRFNPVSYCSPLLTSINKAGQTEGTALSGGCRRGVGWAGADPHHRDQPIRGASLGQCYPDEAEVPLPYQVPQLRPRLGQAASLPAAALSGPLSVRVSARRPAVGRLMVD